jgi:hypothetical protein
LPTEITEMMCSMASKLTRKNEHTLKSLEDARRLIALARLSPTVSDMMNKSNIVPLLAPFLQDNKFDALPKAEALAFMAPICSDAEDLLATPGTIAKLASIWGIDDIRGQEQVMGVLRLIAEASPRLSRAVVHSRGLAIPLCILRYHLTGKSPPSAREEAAKLTRFAAASSRTAAQIALTLGALPILAAEIEKSGSQDTQIALTLAFVSVVRGARGEEYHSCEISRERNYICSYY